MTMWLGLGLDLDPRSTTKVYLCITYASLFYIFNIKFIINNIYFLNLNFFFLSK